MSVRTTLRPSSRWRTDHGVGPYCCVPDCAAELGYRPADGPVRTVASSPVAVGSVENPVEALACLRCTAGWPIPTRSPDPTSPSLGPSDDLRVAGDLVAQATVRSQQVAVLGHRAGQERGVDLLSSSTACPDHGLGPGRCLRAAWRSAAHARERGLRRALTSRGRYFPGR